MVDGEAVDQLRGQSEDVMLGVRDTTTTQPTSGATTKSQKLLYLLIIF